MKTTPKQFAHLLAHSSLSESERQAVLQIIPTLDTKQIEEIAQTLRLDAKEKKKLCRMIRSKQKKIHTKFESDLDKAELATLADKSH